MLRSPFTSPGPACAAPEPATALPLPGALTPRLVEQLHRLKGDLRLGLPVILQDGTGSVLVALVETLAEARHGALAALGGVELALTRRRAEALSGHGIEVVEPVPLEVGHAAHNARHLATEAAKSGHLL